MNNCAITTWWSFVRLFINNERTTAMKRKYNSRKRTPWENSEMTATQKFISDKYKDNYKKKHPKLSETDEHILINNITVLKCRRCDSENIKKNGYTKNGIQRYYCSDCHKDFLPITNTIFENHKISISEWIEYCLDIINYGSLSLTSKVNKNSISTSIYWFHKLFLLLKEYQNNIVLKGNVYIDETFYSVLPDDIITKNEKKLRGLSQNQYCIGVGCDGTNVIAIIEGMGKTSSKKTKDTFSKHIQSGSRLIHDDEKSHKSLVKELSLIDESYNSKYLKKLNDKNNPLDMINNVCDLLKKFLSSHSGFNRDDFEDYLNLFCFITSSPSDKLKKVEILLNLALSTKVTLKYRDLFNVTSVEEDNHSAELCK